MTEETFEQRVIREIDKLYVPLARIEQKQDDLKAQADQRHSDFREELLGDGGRIVKLEAAQSWNDKKQWIHSAVIVPIISVIVGAAKKMGWI